MATLTAEPLSAAKETVLTAEQLFGTAKRIYLELEKLPGETHATIMSVLNSMLQHRGLQRQAIEQAKQQERDRQMQDRQMKLMEQEQERQIKAESDRARAALAI